MENTLDEVFEELHALIRDEDRPICTAPELAERLDQSRRKTLGDLRLLERNGEVKSFKAGANARVWWPTNILGAFPSAVSRGKETGVGTNNAGYLVETDEKDN